MKLYTFANDPGVITGQENNNDLFIRKTVFSTGYSEAEYHNHPNSFEFYVILQGNVEFESVDKNSFIGTKGSIVYFEIGEPHRIVTVRDDVEMLLIKKIGSLKG